MIQSQMRLAKTSLRKQNYSPQFGDDWGQRLGGLGADSDFEMADPSGRAVTEFVV